MQLKAGEESIFPNDLKTQVLVSQSTYGHTPCVGFELVADHGNLDGPCSGFAHFEVERKATRTSFYKLTFVGPIEGASVVAFNLGDSTGDEQLEALPLEDVPQTIIDANKKGMFPF